MQWSLHDLPLAWMSPESIGYEDDDENRNEDDEENDNEDDEENEDEDDDEDDNENDEGNNDEDDDGDDYEASKQSDAILRRRRNVSLAEDAFAHLTDIDINFGTTRNTPKLFKALANFLAKAKKLVRLELSVYVSYIKPEEPPYDMLLEISHVEWPRLRHLNLEGFQLSGTLILRMLSCVDMKLKSLSILRCGLIDEESSWPKLYREMRLIPFRALDHLDFEWCRQSAFQDELLSSAWIGPNDLDAQQVSFVMEDDSGLYVIQYPPVIYDFILKRTDTMPPARCVRAEDYASGLNNNLH